MPSKHERPCALKALAEDLRWQTEGKEGIVGDAVDVYQSRGTLCLQGTCQAPPQRKRAGQQVNPRKFSVHARENSVLVHERCTVQVAHASGQPPREPVPSLPDFMDSEPASR